MGFPGRPSRGFASGLSPGTINGNVTVTGTLGAGNTQITGTLGVTGAVDIDTSLNVDGAIHADGAIDTDTTLTVDGASTLTGTVTASADLNVAGQAKVTKAVVADETFLPPLHRFIAATGYTPTWYSRCNETAGALKDEVANASLTVGAGGGQLFQYHVSGGRHGNSAVRNRGVFQSTASATGGWYADVSDLAAGDWLLGCYFSATTPQAGNRPLFGRADVDAVPGAYPHIDGSGGNNPNKAEFQLYDGVLSINVALDKTVTDGVPRLMMWRRSGVNLDGYIRGAGEAAVTVNQDVTGLATLTGGAAPQLIVGVLPAVQESANVWFGGLFVIVGAGATAASFATIDTALGITV